MAEKLKQMGEEERTYAENKIKIVKETFDLRQVKSATENVGAIFSLKLNSKLGNHSPALMKTNLIKRPKCLMYHCGSLTKTNN